MAQVFQSTKAPFTIDLNDLRNDSSLLKWLTEEKVQWISDVFLVRRELIDGGDDGIFVEQHYDKQPGRFLSVISQFADALTWQDVPASAEAWFVRSGVGSQWAGNGNEVFLIVRVPMAQLSDELIAYRYISNFYEYAWNDGRTSVQLRAWARLLLISKGISIMAIEVSRPVGEHIASNSLFLDDLFNDFSKIPRCRDDWHPEDSTLYASESVCSKPDEFIQAMIEFLKRHGLPFGEVPDWAEIPIRRQNKI